MDVATLGTIGTLLVGVGAVLGAAVTWLGKRSENALTGYSSLTDNLQEERDRWERRATDLQEKLAERDARIAELNAQRAADQAELARQRALIITLGGTP